MGTLIVVYFGVFQFISCKGIVLRTLNGSAAVRAWKVPWSPMRTS